MRRYSRIARLLRGRAFLWMIVVLRWTHNMFRDCLYLTCYYNLYLERLLCLTCSDGTRRCKRYGISPVLLNTQRYTLKK
ncbi:hypothetical protein BJY04DRAFT_48519 [Aspergillus karnatakaensis]|uniref:uncharacterized protein n=1 Tax=Aspergillus karnatakaensis TaxID=1810916 RepID=UPI003CCDB46E